MQMPRLTMLNGQTAVINTSDEQNFVTGLEIVYRDGRIEYRPMRNHSAWRSDGTPLGRVGGSTLRPRSS